MRFDRFIQIELRIIVHLSDRVLPSDLSLTSTYTYFVIAYDSAAHDGLRLKLRNVVDKLFKADISVGLECGTLFRYFF